VICIANTFGESNSVERAITSCRVNEKLVSISHRAPRLFPILATALCDAASCLTYIINALAVAQIVGGVQIRWASESGPAFFMRWL
jgi:hypothetical protein